MDKNAATKLKDLNLINRLLFDEVMEDRESYQAAVSILLGEDILLLDEPEAEKSGSHRIKRIHEQVKRIKMSEKMG